MTVPAIDIDTVVGAARATWLEKLHDLWEFFNENPSMIDGMDISVIGWTAGSKAEQREQVVHFSDLLGPCTVDGETGHLFAHVASNTFSPHSTSLFAAKTVIGHKVQDAIPEKWEWDALQH